MVQEARRQPMKRHLGHDESDLSQESKYRPSRKLKRTMRDPWLGQAKSEPAESSDSESHLVANDAPFVMESSDSEGPAQTPANSTPNKVPTPKRRAEGLSIAGQAKRAGKKLNKKDRLQYWHNKASAPLPAAEEASP